LTNSSVRFSPDSRQIVRVCLRLSVEYFALRANAHTYASIAARRPLIILNAEKSSARAAGRRESLLRGTHGELAVDVSRTKRRATAWRRPRDD
jgi:hypothetical protein